jgi:hypothetical protein
MGYEDGAGQPRSIPGDDESAWLKTPPFSSKVTRWFKADDLESGASYVFLDAVDVRQQRLLAIWLEWESDEIDHTLRIIPQARRDVDGSFYTISVIDPLLTVIPDIGAPFAANELFGQRNMYATALNLPSVPGSETIARQCFVFDVAAYTQFRLALGNIDPQGALAEGGEVTIDYNFSG